MTSLICELDARGGRHQEEKDEGAALRPRQSGGRLEKAAEEEEAHEVVLCWQLYCWICKGFYTILP